MTHSTKSPMSKIKHLYNTLEIRNSKEVSESKIYNMKKDYKNVSLVRQNSSTQFCHSIRNREIKGKTDYLNIKSVFLIENSCMAL